MGDERELPRGPEPVDDTEDDVTVVSPAAFDEDATVVSSRTLADDETVVRPREDDDQTVVRSRVEDDQTVVRSHSDRDSAIGALRNDDAPVPDKALPLQTQDHETHDDETRVAGQATDHIESAEMFRPATVAAEPLSGGDASLTSRAEGPHMYRVRQVETQASPSSQRVEQQSAPVPAGHGESPSTDRPRLPSFAKRYRREKVITLIAYAAAISISVVGLTFVARIAFS